MKKNLLKFSDIEHCPIRNILDRFGDKWSILILLILSEEGTLRFNQLHKIIGSISQKVLSTTLKKLEADNLVIRKIYPEVPPRVEYSLSSISVTLIPHLKNLEEWADEHFNEIKDSRTRYKK